ncbi:hypothetical protein C4559_02740 [Candidatus Microgenomates bacterium]|nr:MAG: hypothetical protein C4559_02740 [Candidatus Microgenomates bacterium]
MKKAKKKVAKNKTKISTSTRRKKIKTKSKKSFLFLFITAVGLASIIILFSYNSRLRPNNSSLTVNETLGEIKNKTVPEDVKKAIEEKQKLNQESSSSSAVIGTTNYKIPILMYHYVEYVQDKGDTIRISLDTNPHIFEEQIKTLKNAGYIFLTNNELSKIIDGKYEVPKHPIILTFDDGYRDFYTDVLPILKKYNVKATAYIISGFTGRPNHLTKQQLQEIINSRLVEIGAHTVDHVWLKGKSSKDVTYEVTTSKKQLEEEFQIQITSFAYPFGAFDQQALEIVKNAGFKTATSTIPGIEQNQENKFFLSRLRPGGRTGQGLLNWLNQKTFSEYF